MFDNLKISLKLQVMVAVAIIGILAVALVGLWNLRDNVLEDRKARVRELVLLAREIVDLDHQRAIKAGLSEDAAKEQAKDTLRHLRFDGTNFFFAIDSHGLNVANPDPRQEGRNNWDARDSDGVYFARQLIAQANRGGGFSAYRFPRVGGNQPLPKIGYSVRFDPYDWAIGAGVYIDDVDAIFWSQVEHVGLIILLVLAVVVAGSVMLSRGVTRPLAVITGAMRRLADGDKAISTPYGARRDEIGRLAQSLDVFRDNAVRLDAAEEERRTAEERAAEDRRRAALRIADEFESRVKAVVEAVSSGSTDLRGMAEPCARPRRRPASAPASSPAPPSRPRPMSAPSPPRRRSSPPRSSEISRQVARAAEHRQRAVERDAPDRRDGQGAGRRAPSKHRRGGAAHQRHRRPDQPAGAQRHDRGGARRRGGQGLRRRRLGGQERSPTRPAKATEEIGGADRRRSRATPTTRSAAIARHRRHHRRGQRDREPRSPRRSRSRARRRGRSPATPRRRRRAPARSRPTSPPSATAPRRPARSPATS